MFFSYLFVNCILVTHTRETIYKILIFASHDTNLLRYSHLRRDQINFVEKNDIQATEVYSLSDFRYFNDQTERPDVDKEKRYLEGRYGAVPLIGAFNKKISTWHQ